MTTGLPHGKPAPQRTKRSQQTALDRKESAKVRERSRGRCEVRVNVVAPDTDTVLCVIRCQRLAFQVHHMIGGRGKRLSAEGVKAERKQHVCYSCHLYITGDVGGKRLVLVPSGPLPVYTDCYRLVR